jgi:hypothetical protein
VNDDATVPFEPGVPPIAGAWSAYRTWANTARYHRRALDRGQSWSLWLGIAGVVSIAAGQQITLVFPHGDAPLAIGRAAGALGSAIIALAAYVGSQVLGGDREQLWLRCRVAAESLKSTIYLFRASVAPFDTAARAEELKARVEKSLEELEDVPVRALPVEPTAPPSTWLTVDTYRKERVADQITWYRQRSLELESKSDRYRKLTLLLGALSVLLGLASSIGFLSTWVAVIGTGTASITAYVQNQRYQPLIGIYLATATRLQVLSDEWLGTDKRGSDKLARDQFIQRCEETLAAENGAWVARRMQPQPRLQPPPVQPPPKPN